MSTRKRPSSLSQTRTDPSRVVVANRSPCGENFAAITWLSWRSARTCFRVARSQSVTSPRRGEEPGRVLREIDSLDITVMVLVLQDSFVCRRVPQEHVAMMGPRRSPSVIVRHCQTRRGANCLHRSHSLAVLHSPHLDVVDPLFKRCFPFAVNVTTRMSLRALISMGQKHSCQVSVPLQPYLDTVGRTGHCRRHGHQRRI